MSSHVYKESLSCHFSHGQWQDLDQNAEQVTLIESLCFLRTPRGRTAVLIKNPLQTLNLLQGVIMFLLCANLGRHLF